MVLIYTMMPDIYVDGVSITMGSPHKHLWAYAAGCRDDKYATSNCPCAAVLGSFLFL